MIEKIWQLTTTFTPESKQIVFTKCTEFGFDTSRGDITLEESYINLDSCVLILKEAIEKRKLIQLPITVQKIILSILEAISTSQTNMIAGSDQVAALNNQIESLNASMWQYGMFNLSDEVLGYQTKINQLKSLELEITNLNNELKEGIELKKTIDTANQEAHQKLQEINKALEDATIATTKINQSLAESNATNQQITAILDAADKNGTAITKSKADATISEAEIESIEQEIKEFFNEINDYKKKIDKTSNEATTAITTNTEQTKTLISELKDLENQIKEQIEKATGYSLFHSFQTRQELIKKSKYFWTYVLAALLCLTGALTYYLVQTITSIDTAFFLKLSLSIPIIFAISFSTLQYSRERRLEEEYAFKSNISISLKPYQELVEKLISADENQRKEYATFIMNTINKVFTSPTTDIFKEKASKGLIDIKVLKEVGTLTESLAKIKTP